MTQPLSDFIAQAELPALLSLIAALAQREERWIPLFRPLIYAEG